ncbi:type II secretion system protein [Candidatus Wolfebacteria bacterium]|nr:type II secretion system protein [Candidatus Wolfebacteria bacterium]
MNKINKKGFTLLELLIVIAILGVLGSIVVFMLNPAETLKKARDSQRISDLSTIKTALGIYLTSTSSPQLSNTSGNTLCLGGGGTITAWSSFPVTATTTPTSDYGTFTSVVSVAQASSSLVDGTGWIPVNLTSLIGSSPISGFPIDPINDNTDLIYRYACRKSPLGFEIDASLESEAFTIVDDKRLKDGGNNNSRFEAGSDLKIIKI